MLNLKTIFVIPRFIHLVISSFVLILFLNGCAQDSAYRPQLTLCEYSQAGDCASHAVQQYGKAQDDEYFLSFIEYDDQGQVRDRNQMQAVLGQYREIAGQEDVLLITFVHGWHHNARPGDGNIMAFRDLLANLSLIESRHSITNGIKPRRILGLYIGWRGESLEVPLIKHLTFWDRKNTAHDVGMQGVTETLIKLEEIVNVKAGIETQVPKPLNSRLVVIGHSFGGAVVYSALQQILVDRFVDSRRGKTFVGDANGFGDLVVLVNPAFEALRFASLYDLSQQSCRRYFASQLPKLALLTSENDKATKYAFPVGRFFSTLFESHNTLQRHQCDENGESAIEIAEAEADRTAIGHFQPYQTHSLIPSEKLKRAENFNFQDLKALWAGQTHKAELRFEEVKLIHYGKTRPRNPYLNIKVNRDLIADHNAIWDPRVASFVRDLLVISTLPNRGKP